MWLLFYITYLCKHYTYRHFYLNKNTNKHTHTGLSAHLCSQTAASVDRDTEFRLESVHDYYPWHYAIPLHNEIRLRHRKILQVCDMKGKFSPLWVVEGFMVQTAECSWFTKSVASFPYFKPTKLADDLQCSVLVCMSQNHVNDVSSKSKAQHWHGITASPPLQRLIAGFTCGNVVTWSHRIGVTFSTYNFEHFYLEKKCIANQVIKIWTATTCRAFAFETWWHHFLARAPLQRGINLALGAESRILSPSERARL